MDKSSFSGNINNYFHIGFNVGRFDMDNQSASGNIQLLSFNDYYPHGSIIPGRSYSSGAPYRCDYQGIEKDGETGFNNFDLRMYDARLGRWFNPDPMQQYFSAYLSMGNNPVSFIDPSGGYDEDDVMHPPRGPMSTRYMSSQNYINELYRNYGTPEERAERERVGTLAQFGDVELGNGRVAQYDSRGNLVYGHYEKVNIVRNDGPPPIGWGEGNLLHEPQILEAAPHHFVIDFEVAQGSGDTDWGGIADASLGIIGGALEVTAGVFGEVLTGGVSTLACVDGVGRIGMNSIRLAAILTGNSAVGKALPSNLGGMAGKIYDGAILNKGFFEIGPAQNVLGVSNDAAAFIIGGGTNMNVMLFPGQVGFNPWIRTVTNNSLFLYDAFKPALQK